MRAGEIPNRLPVLIEQNVVQYQWNVELAARQTKCSRILVNLVARIETVELDLERCKACIHIGGREIETMVVVPQRAECLVRIHSRWEHRIVVIPELAGIGVVHRVAVAFRRLVAVVRVDGTRGHGEADVAHANRRKIIYPAYQDRFAVSRDEGRARRYPIKAYGPHPRLYGRAGEDNQRAFT